MNLSEGGSPRCSQLLVSRTTNGGSSIHPHRAPSRTTTFDLELGGQLARHGDLRKAVVRNAFVVLVVGGALTAFYLVFKAVAIPRASRSHRSRVASLPYGPSAGGFALKPP